MARRKAPENETQVEMEARKTREDISNHATRSEKVSWERQFGNLQKILETRLQPLEEKILDLIVQKNKVYDEMAILRDELMEGCIHPFDHLQEIAVAPGAAGSQYTPYLCKFCNKKVLLNADGHE